MSSLKTWWLRSPTAFLTGAREIVQCVRLVRKARFLQMTRKQSLYLFLERCASYRRCRLNKTSCSEKDFQRLGSSRKWFYWSFSYRQSMTLEVISADMAPILLALVDLCDRSPAAKRWGGSSTIWVHGLTHFTNIMRSHQKFGGWIAYSDLLLSWHAMHSARCRSTWRVSQGHWWTSELSWIVHGSNQCRNTLKV